MKSKTPRIHLDDYARDAGRYSKQVAVFLSVLYSANKNNASEYKHHCVSVT